MKKGATYRKYLQVFNQNDDTPKTGLVNGDFTKKVVRNGAVVAETITVSEVDAVEIPGLYMASFDPADTGHYYALITLDSSLYVPSEFVIEEQCFSNDLDDAVDITFVGTLVPYLIGLDLSITDLDEFTKEVAIDEKTAVDITFTVTKDGNPVDLSGKDVYLVVQKKIGAATNLLQKQGVVSGADNNIATFSLSASDATIEPGGWKGEFSVWTGSECASRRRFDFTVNKVAKGTL